MKKFRLKKKVKVFITIVGVVSITIVGLKVSSIFINATRNDEGLNETTIKPSEKLNNQKVKSTASNGLKGELEQMLVSEPRVQQVIDNFDEYPEEIIKLLIGKPESIEYALEYLNTDKRLIDDIGSVDLNTVPELYQWDPKWGYAEYGDNYLGITGCAPTVLSMATVYLNKDTSMTPYAISKLSAQNGHYASGQGTSWSLFNATEELLDIKSEQLGFNKSSIDRTLDAGGLVVLSVTAGDFTSTGHFILLVGTTSTGEYIIRDPNSVTNTNMTWSYDVLSSQIANLWALYV